MFRLYDMDGDGFLGRDDLRQLLALTVGRAVTPTAVEGIIDRTLRDADADGDGQLSFEDFEQVRAGEQMRRGVRAGGEGGGGARAVVVVARRGHALFQQLYFPCRPLATFLWCSQPAHSRGSSSRCPSSPAHGGSCKKRFKPAPQQRG